MKFTNSYKLLLSSFFFFPLFFSGCDNDKTLIPESAKKELSSRTMVQTKWDNEEERINAHRKRVVENRDSTSDPQITVENSSAPLNSSEKQPNTGQKDKIPTGKYTLQLGAFSNAANAERLVKKLKEQNHDATVSVYDKTNNKLHIVKMGPFKDRVTASKKAATIASFIKLDVAIYVNNRFNGTVKPNKGPKNIVSEEVVDSSIIEDESANNYVRMSGQSFKSSAFANYSFQVGGLYPLQDAQEQRKILEAKGYKLYSTKIVNKENDEIWYSIRIGYFESYVAAGDAAYIFSEKEGIPAQAIQKQLD